MAEKVLANGIVYLMVSPLPQFIGRVLERLRHGFRASACVCKWDSSYGG